MTIMSSPKVGFQICVSCGATDVALGIFRRFGSVSEDPQEDYMKTKLAKELQFFSELGMLKNKQPKGQQ